MKIRIAEDLIAAGRKEVTIIVSSSSSTVKAALIVILIKAFTDLIFVCLIAFRLNHDFDPSPINVIFCSLVLFVDINGYFMYK